MFRPVKQEMPLARVLTLAWVHWVAALVVLIGGCAQIIDAPFDKALVVDEGAEQGENGALAGEGSCQSRAAECGAFRDSVLGVTFQCGGCASNERCVSNKCVCDTVSCEAIGAECGYKNNGCSQLMICGNCAELYPGDPDKAFCGPEGKCGAQPALPRDCDEAKAQGIAADCGTVGLGDVTLECGACSGRLQCINNRCEGYEPLTCEELTGGGTLCGTFPNGAGQEITCACAMGEVCTAGNVCCTPRTECADNACGVVSDGCGGTVDCGGCSDGETCRDNVCCGESLECPPGVCGSQVVVCGQVIECGCADGECCVGAEDGQGECRVPACPTDGRCGDDLDDGCGGTKDGCACPEGQTCNASNMCECVPRGCPEGACDYVDDGCGGQIFCHCDGTDVCFREAGQCCAPTCPSDGSCGLVDDGCGGQKTCGCADGETCSDEKKCVKPECPDSAACGVNLAGMTVLSCRGDCDDGQNCVERSDGIFGCGSDCSAACPAEGSCGLVDVGCTVLSCAGECAVPGQQCVNQQAPDGLDDFRCCSASCSHLGPTTCGDHPDPECGGQVVSCPGSCPDGQACNLNGDTYECVVPQCPANPRCGANTAVPSGTIQCDGYCSGNQDCVKNGENYECACVADSDPCGDDCGTMTSNGCGQQVTCECLAPDQCIKGSCCQPDSLQQVCAQANAECGIVSDPKCGADMLCGTCRPDERCVDNQCVCDESKCEAHENCNPSTGTCECASSECEDGQACMSGGVCSCDSAQCNNGEVCNQQGVCACPQSASEACGPKACGSARNSCGETVDCGACPSGKHCDDNAGACVCDETPAQACSLQECGPAENDCEEPVDCGDCSDNETCGGGVCTCNQGPAEACQGKDCGPVTNICDEQVICANTCDAQYETCQGNQCVCTDTAAAACARANFCGSVTGLTDGCGRPVTDCGGCAGANDVCQNNRCVCLETACEDKVCGSEPGVCTGQTISCGTCDDPEECVSGQCTCTETACAGLECGTVRALCTNEDIPCGTCGTAEDCVNNQCVPCQETACNGKVCGAATSSCTGQTISCGPCEGTCSPDGAICTPPAQDGGL